MVDCGQCGEPLDNLAYNCNYCGQFNCSDHRLPEKHDCIALHLTRPPESSKANADAHLGDPRNFRGDDEDFVGWVEAFRDRHVSDPDTDNGDVESTPPSVEEPDIEDATEDDVRERDFEQVPYRERIKDLSDRGFEPQDGDIDEEELFRETLKEASNATDAEVERVAENVKEELEDPDDKPYSVFEPKYTVGSQPDPDFASSPDVAPDGSIVSDDAGAETAPEPVRSRGGPFGVAIEIVAVCLLLGFLAAIVFLL